MYVEDRVTKLNELCSLQRLGENVTRHIAGRAVLDGQLLGLHPVGDEKITDVDEAGLFARGAFSVFL